MLRRSDGFSLIELLVAILILSMGLLGIATLSFSASSTTFDTKAREGATNLAREVVEDVVAQPYSTLAPATIAGRLQTLPALAPTGSGWTVMRRSISYTLSVTGCYVDDPTDGHGTHDSSFCSGSTAGTADAQPVDYKRFSVDVTWSRRGVSHTITQSTLIAGKGARDVPSVTNLSSGSGLTISDPAVSSLSFTATTSATPAGVAWSLDQGVRGLASGSGTNWSFTWNLSGVPDGQYVIGAQAYNSAGTYGTPVSLTITLNRATASPPQAFVAGWNRATSKVDSEWLASSALDTAGYTVYRQQTYPVAGMATRVNCGTVGTPVYVVTIASCTDASPILPAPGADGNITYRASSSNDVGNSSSLTITKPAGTIPGDVLVATVAVNATPGITAPAGWTLIVNGTRSTALQVASFYHVAGASEPASYNFTTADGTLRILAGGMAAYAGVDATSPIDVSGFTQGAGGNISSPDLTTTQANDMVVNVAAFIETAAGGTITQDASLTERYDRQRNPLLTNYAGATQAAAGATGAKLSVPSVGTSAKISLLFALKAAITGNTGLGVNYWVVALDRDASGNLREGLASNVVDAYVTNRQPNPITGSLTCVTGTGGFSTLTWSQPAQPGDVDSGDHIAFDRIYRDGARFDRTGLATDSSYVDANPSGTHSYYVTTVDTHLAESIPTGTVTC